MKRFMIYARAQRIIIADAERKRSICFFGTYQKQILGRSLTLSVTKDLRMRF
jgi:hypothetical protein